MNKTITIALLSSLLMAPIAYSQTIAVKPKPKASGLSLLPPPPPVLDNELRKDLQQSKKLDSDKRAIVVEKQKELDAVLTPFTPEQILHMQKNAREIEKVTNSGVNGKARNLIDRDMVWSIGAGSQKVHLGPGYTTTLLFFDGTGRPVPVAPAGAIVGDKDAIDANATGNAVVLYVTQPWRSTNLTVFLMNVPVPVQFSLTSDRDSNVDIDGQIRVRIVDANAASSLQRGDMQNVNALLQLTNGAPGASNMAILPVVSVEKGDPARLNWTPIVNNIAQFRVGPDGLTYVLLKPTFKLLYPNVPNVLSSLTGADGTEGYIVAGNNPRVFTIQDQNGALYRITVQR